MNSGIKFTSTEMKYIALFESISGANVKDCIVDEEQGRVIFVVKEGDLGAAIGRGGRNIRLLERMTGKKHEIIEHSDDPAQFIKNALKPAMVQEVRITERTDGKTIAVVTVHPRDKGVAIGKNGRNAERLRMLVKRYFQIQNVSIV
ncbi:MAG: NusA-like transcription termination signal-binding factor [Candidatus Bathyarchaeota archaeon]|jgi:N utilization substance protein A|nr:NusA-like transcription termination signal-binding factor [Candidatus Bathyarchaeota archaeon A05DMB-3]MDH7606674.1 NusA-like transcription termination signal-binding factor [Candidatus Bathyarchaeota archaeon]